MRAFLAAILMALAAHAAAEEAKSFLLVSKKGMRDPFFAEAVVLVVRDRAPLGVILNKPQDTTLGKIFADDAKLKALTDRVYFGGPVKPEALVFVFRAAAAPKDSVELLPGVYLSASREVLDELLRRDRPAEGLRVYAGHSGWAPGQLEAEIERGSWHLARADARHIFHSNPRGLWRQLESRATATQARGPSERVSR